MSLSIPFPFWVDAEQNAARGVEVNISLAFLYGVGIALNPGPFISDIAMFAHVGPLHATRNTDRKSPRCFYPPADFSVRLLSDVSVTENKCYWRRHLTTQLCRSFDLVTVDILRRLNFTSYLQRCSTSPLSKLTAYL